MDERCTAEERRLRKGEMREVGVNRNNSPPRRVGTGRENGTGKQKESESGRMEIVRSECDPTTTG